MTEIIGARRGQARPAAPAVRVLRQDVPTDAHAPDAVPRLLLEGKRGMIDPKLRKALDTIKAEMPGDGVRGYGDGRGAGRAGNVHVARLSIGRPDGLREPCARRACRRRGRAGRARRRANRLRVRRRDYRRADPDPDRHLASTATTEAAAAVLRRLGVPVAVGRFEALADASGPSILLRLADVAALGTIDPAPGPAAAGRPRPTEPARSPTTRSPRSPRPAS